MQVTHLFSHRRHLYHCWHMQLAGDHDKSTLLSSSWLVPSSSQEDTLKWVGRQEIKETGVPASVNKVLIEYCTVDPRHSERGQPPYKGQSLLYTLHSPKEYNLSTKDNLKVPFYTHSIQNNLRMWTTSLQWTKGWVPSMSIIMFHCIKYILISMLDNPVVGSRNETD